MRKYQIFGSQTVIPYLADHLQSLAYVVEIKEGINGREHFFNSSYIEIILATKSASSLPKPLLSVLKLIDVTFDKSGYEQKAETCANGILSILSGIAKAKYGEASISMMIDNPSQAVKKGKVIDIIRGKLFTKVTHTVPMRIGVTLSREDLEKADRQKPTGKEMWDLAMNNEYIARALYYLSEAKGEDRYNLNKVYEEIEEDVGSDRLKQWIGGEKKFQAFMEWANDDYISGKNARHSGAAALSWIKRLIKERELRTRYRRESFPGAPCPIDFQDIIQKWITAKQSR